MKGLPFGRRFGFALQGLRQAVRGERSLRSHLLATAAVLLLLLLTRPAAIWWAVLLLAVGLVLVAELLNSALEGLLDHLHPARHPAVGAVKDIAAGAVLVASLVALLVGVAFLGSLL
ncbi:diacylglycerol kinase [Stutzerimonas balearica]|uniref:diacylglycerol kinase n=1 Tax=Stutzerimonas balearica TaxID=74829 RepID=UPI00077440BF|nr:diacylglycerol kinase [Stutzerimonas balearica]MBK3749247.1 diacylglycerol kinase [Stutzerimonas balearica]MBK3827444.1 diacylglycerol kinase [Stutzerimonas balearica]MBK3857134.1 diacylglycerol kinase [Stutzerimonas balearica]MBS4148566.1 diacylglycerol kinase [Stutzerimonas balearica]OMG61928.1 diacylglycerol kinase [Stutzerimonas balearica]